MRLLVTISIAFNSLTLYAQEIFIGDETNGVQGAILQINDDSRGLLIPRIPNVSMGFFPSSGADGMMVYDPIDGHLHTYDNSEWKPISSSQAGMIVMWTDPGNIPEGWSLCNGYYYDPGNPVDIASTPSGNRTVKLPDLRSYFIAIYDPSDPEYGIGPSSIGEDFISLTINQLPSHSHGITDSGHIHTGSASHSHLFPRRDLTAFILETDADGGVGGGNSTLTKSSTTGNSDPGNVTYTSTTNSSSLVVGNIGGSMSHENRPPYYVLAFIIKL